MAQKKSFVVEIDNLILSTNARSEKEAKNNVSFRIKGFHSAELVNQMIAYPKRGTLKEHAKQSAFNRRDAMRNELFHKKRLKVEF